MTEPTTQPQPETPRMPPQEEGDPLRDLQDRLGPQLEAAQAQLEEVNERVKTFIKKNPGSTMLGALAIGFLVGKWASRR
jgi:ElaB/YqjD/DUF883 family membrane-anchored ribosome-binding protein